MAFITFMITTFDYNDIMLIGPIEAVKNLQIINSTLITWNAPPSLDLTNTDPDVIYSVEIYNTTCGERISAVNDSNVLELNYPINFLNMGFIHEVIVTPRSNVAGAISGLKSELYGKYIQLYSHLVVARLTCRLEEYPIATFTAICKCIADQTNCESHSAITG